MTFIWWLVTTIGSGVLYRLGGEIETKIRDFGVPTIVTLQLLVLGYPIYLWSIVALIAHFGLLFASLTTYWGFINPWFGYKKEDKYWWNWLLTGLFYGLSALPIAIVLGHWLTFAFRIIILTAFTTIWSELISDVNWEERGRGGAIAATMPLLLI